MSFAALADLKLQLNIPPSDTTQDGELQFYVDTSNEVVESLIGASAVTTYTELQTSTDGGAIILMRRPLVSVTSVTPVVPNGVALDPSTYTVDVNRGGLIVNTPSGVQDYSIVYTAGWSAPLPQRAKLALLMIARHLWATTRGGMAPSVMTSDVITVVPGFGFAVPQRALELLSSLGGPSMIPGIA